jgi:Na+/H+ antiporter NhaD/arsenite permease-like protein
MKKYIQLFIASFVVMFGLVAAPLATPVSAVDVFQKGCKAAGGGEDSGGSAICGATTEDDVPGFIETIVNTILIVLGMIAVIMIIIGGIRYTTSNGDASNIKSAKDTILYAVIGLIVAILSYAIVNFVLGRFGGGGS